MHRALRLANSRSRAPVGIEEPVRGVPAIRCEEAEAGAGPTNPARRRPAWLCNPPPPAGPLSALFGPRSAHPVAPRDSVDELLDGLALRSPPARSSALFGANPSLSSLFASADQPGSTSSDSALGALLAEVAASSPPPQPGPNPLRFLGYAIDRARGSVALFEAGPDGHWREHPELDRVPLRDLPWLSQAPDAASFETVFPLYDWKRNGGAQWLPTWIEQAARQVGRSSPTGA